MIATINSRRFYLFTFNFFLLGYVNHIVYIVPITPLHRTYQSANTNVLSNLKYFNVCISILNQNFSQNILLPIKGLYNSEIFIQLQNYVNSSRKVFKIKLNSLSRQRLNLRFAVNLVSEKSTNINNGVV